MQVALAPDERVPGLQVSAEGCSLLPVIRLKIKVLVTPPAVALTVTDSRLEMRPVAPVKVPVVLPAGITNEAGTERRMLLSDTVTSAPPAGAGPESVVVQVVEEFGPTIFGLHERSLRGGTTGACVAALVVAE